jgi:hypothetical protein
MTEKNKPLGLKITEFLTLNFVWYSIFSLIYFDFNPLNWWLITSIWGRMILLVLEYGVIMSSFNNKKNEKN